MSALLLYDAQDELDGRALRLLREALPELSGWFDVRVTVLDNGTVDYFVEDADGWLGQGATIAEAADKCREALK